MQDVHIPAPEDRVAIRLRRVAELLALGDRASAERELRPLVGITCQTHPIAPMPTLNRESWPKGSGASTRNPPPIVLARTYTRDGFTCRYCARRTIPTQILRLISTAFPSTFPYHPKWRKDIAPRAYWDISTSVDHIRAVSTGGDWQDPGNLATACARCQYQKSNLPLTMLGWTHHPVTRMDWDGGVGLYRNLWEALGRPQTREHSTWIRAFATVTQ
jgi:5-methylcytosine-specific restriction endonuclease McrA